jgi:dihydrofolate reductase
MRKLAISTFLTLDGVMQAPGGPEDDPAGGFRHGGWSVAYWDEGMGQRMDEALGSPFDLLLGRRTYEIFAAHWPHVTDHPAADALNGARKYVPSRTLERVEWTNSTLLPGDVAEEVSHLKDEDGPEIQVHGSGDLIQTLLAHDLVDELHLVVIPVVVGSGKRLFGSGAVPARFDLVSVATTGSGVVAGTYARAGALTYGAMGPETGNW